MNVFLFVVGALLLVLAGTLLVLGTGQYLALEEHRLADAPPLLISTWFEQSNPKYFKPEVRPAVVKMRRLNHVAVLTFLLAAFIMWRSFK